MSEEQTAKTDKKKHIVLVSAVVAGVLVLAGAGLGLYRNSQVQALEGECNTAVASVKISQKELADLVASDDVVTALKVTDKQVADKKVLVDLKQAVENADSKLTFPDCKVAFFDFNTNPAAEVNNIGKTVASKSTTVTGALEAVNKSVSAKQFADAKDKLQKIVDNASKVLSDSDGKVQDNAVRDSLKKVIDNAKKILADKKNTDIKKLDTKALEDTVNSVNASIEAKRQADEEAARKAAEEASRQTQATQNMWTPQYSGGNSGYNTPAPQNNSGGSGNSDGFTPYTPQKPGDTIFGPATINESCASGGYCPLG